MAPLLPAIFPNVNQDDLGTFQARLQKTAATGGTFALTHSVAYAMSNNPTQLYSSDWNVKLVAEMRQPLLQGAGVQFNRIAGPGATPGAVQRRDARADQHRHRVDQLRDERAEPRQRRGDGLLGVVLRLPAIRRGDHRDATTPWRCGGRSTTLFTHRQPGRRSAKPRRPDPRSILSSYRSTAEQAAQRACTPPKSKLRYLMGLARHRRPADPSQGRSRPPPKSLSIGTTCWPRAWRAAPNCANRNGSSSSAN